MSSSPVLFREDGGIRIEWPNPMPRWFDCTPEALRQLVDEINQKADALRTLGEAIRDIEAAGFDASIDVTNAERLEAIIHICRLPAIRNALAPQAQTQ